MLTTTTNINQQSSLNADAAVHIAPTASQTVGTASIKNNNKNELFPILSPPENIKIPTIIDDAGSNINVNSTKTKDINSNRNCEPQTLGSNVLRQNSNNTNNSCNLVASIGSAISPNNGSEHSNSSNISQVENVATDILQDIENVEKAVIKKKNTKKEDEIGNTMLNDKLNSSRTGMNALIAVKDEPEIINVNVKKEENLSPHLSPVGFGAIGSTSNVDRIPRSVTPVKLNEVSTSTMVNTNEKILGTIDDAVCVNPLGTSEAIDSCGGGASGNSQQIASNNFSISAGQIPNCMDYMQQQNHIFVFSTQLANKGAESVLNGQFQTIIAYHCTQPATKSFLEDFFIKNPMKMNKLQRQNSLNLCNLTGSQNWMNHSVANPAAIAKMQQQQKPTGGSKLSFTQADNKNQNVRVTNMTSIFTEGAESMSNENELLCWEQARNSLENVANETHTAKLLSESGDAIVASLNKAVDASGETNVPSLQGVKVPDENLTPQQRQHREEQLAKIKKMNQFLFPENGNEFRTDSAGNVQVNKLVNENVGSNMSTTAMVNIVGSAQQINNSINVRQLPINNLSNQSKPENITGLAEEVLVPSDIMDDINQGLQCNTQKTTCGSINSQANLSCGPSNNLGGNIISGHASNPVLMPSSPEIINNFGGIDSMKSDIVQGPMSQIEWTKMQQQFFEDRMKGNKSTTDMISNCRRSTLPGSTGLVIPSNNTGNQHLRSGQGPPPPYYTPQTQRSASVPIATQSPNPASPNNPTSNLSLPSPRTTGTHGIPLNSPSVDSTLSTSATNTSNVLTTTITTGSTNSNSKSKACFQSEGGSPSNRNRNCGNNGANLHQFNSNPSTPLSHMSPKENLNNVIGDLKSTRMSPQRSPSNAGPNSNIVESAIMETRFPTTSPGLNFLGHAQNSAISTPNNYKAPNPMERQNSVSGPGQICRRSDNMPLNPNSNRLPQSKINHGFDPISSLAQMSQQLTSCVAGVGTSSAGTINVLGGPNDINMAANINQNMEAMMSTLDGGMDHCNPPGNLSGNVSHIGGAGPYGSGGNCHINPMMNPIGHRLLNPKVCSGGFNTVGNNNSVRDNSNNFHGVVPPTRMMGRMPLSFGNFNVSPNIQVKASAPNTIQYMPVRPQNNNNSRVPPSLEFLQRYANPQMIGSGVNINENGHVSQINSTINEQPKLSNSSHHLAGGSGVGSNIGLPFFPNCNQITGMDEDVMSSGILPAQDINMGQSIIRGMRPMRQLNFQGPRMQEPNNMTVPQFIAPHHDSLECNETSPIFNSNVPNNTSATQQMFTASVSQTSHQQKVLKSITSTLCQNINSQNSISSGAQGQVPTVTPSLLQNDINTAMEQQSMNGPVLLGGNNNIITSGNNGSSGNPGGNGNLTFKPFVGPNSSDLKYAQQYHSFQQQLYATSTRSQGVSNVQPNASPNPGFFINK